MVEIYLLNEDKQGKWKEFVKVYANGRIMIYDEFYDKEQGVYLLNTVVGLSVEGSLKLKKILTTTP